MSDYKRLTYKDNMNEFCDYADCVADCGNCYLQRLYNRLAELEDKIENGELAEVKHGKWIEYPRYRTKQCSVCKRMHVERLLGYYCPFCGAKMDLEVEDV